MGVSRPIDVEPKHLKILLGLLENHLPGVSVWVFGSRVKWTSRPDSDLDLVVFAKPEQSRNVHALKEALEESSLPFRVDVLVWDAISDAFHDNIRKEYVELVNGAKKTGAQRASHTAAYGAEWRETTIGEQLTLQRGFDITKATQEPGCVPVISSGGTNSYHSTAMVKGPGVVLGRKGVIGSVYFVREDYWPHDTTLWVKDFHGNDELFAYYFFLSKAKDLAQLDVGSANPTLNRNHVHPIKTLWPPLNEQREIASSLGALDDRIALLRETNATLEAIAQTLFKSWFVDFDPVHAKAKGEEPEGLPEDIAGLFPDSFEESLLGLVPRGWRVLPLEEAYEINPTRKLKKGETAPYLDMASVATSGHTVTGAIEREMGSGTKFINGDTLLARITPCLENGKTAFVDFLSDEQTGWGSTEFVVLRPKAPLPSYHGYLLSRHPAFREHAIQSMSGTSGRQRVQNDVLGRYPVVVPSEAIATAFGEVVGGIQQKIASNHQQSQTLATLRDTLLPRLISGQLRLTDTNAEQTI